MLDIGCGLGKFTDARIDPDVGRKAFVANDRAPGSLPTARVPAASVPADKQALENEIEAIRRALDERGSSERRELAGLVGARYWGPGVFREALRRAIADGDVQRTSRSTFAPAYHDGNAEP